MPSTEIVTNPEMLYIAIGIIGATVMPHNLYLHSSIVQTRAYERTDAGRKRRHQALRPWDSTIALMMALVHQCSSILIIAASVFHIPAGHHGCGRNRARRYELLSPLLGLGIASTLVCGGVVGVWFEFDCDSNTRGPDRDGRFSAVCGCRCGRGGFADTRRCHYACHFRDLDLWREAGPRSNC
jgi:hypothetical protein